MEHSNLKDTATGNLVLEQQVKVQTSKKRLRIGVPKELTENEQRVPLTPDSVETLVMSGVEVLIQEGAGEAAGYTNEEYVECGATITANSLDIFRSDIIVKVAFPDRLEVGLMNIGSIVFSCVYCDTPQALVAMRCMAEKKITAIAFERITDNSGQMPILKALEQIAGKTAVLVASDLLTTRYKGKGFLLCEVPGIEPLNLLVLGSGTIADAAAKTATSLGVNVTVLGTPPDRLGELGKLPIDGMLYSSNLSKHLAAADVVIGTVNPMDDEYYMIGEDLVKRMKKGAIIVDVLAGKGGCFGSTTSRPLEDPTYKKHGVTHFCVSNITSLVAHTASTAISNILLPVLLKLSRTGSIVQLLKEELGVCEAVYLFKGIHTNVYIAKQHQVSAQNINLLLNAL